MRRCETMANRTVGEQAAQSASQSMSPRFRHLLQRIWTRVPRDADERKLQRKFYFLKSGDNERDIFVS